MRLSIHFEGRNRQAIITPKALQPQKVAIHVNTGLPDPFGSMVLLRCTGSAWRWGVTETESYRLIATDKNEKQDRSGAMLQHIRYRCEASSGLRSELQGPRGQPRVVSSDIVLRLATFREGARNFQAVSLPAKP